jgi:hypothetical protein
VWTRLFDALGTAVRIEAEESLAGPLLDVFGTFAEVSGPPSLEYLIACGDGEWRLWRGQALVTYSVEPLDLVACLEGDLLEQLLERSSGWCLHAAVVGDERGAAALAGVSGAGKSTLAQSLVARGMRYLSDERALIDPSLNVRGLLRPIGIDADSSASLPAGARVVAYPTARPQGRLSRLVHLPAHRLEPRALPLRMLVLLSHAPERAPEVRRLSPGEALSLLWAHSLRPGKGAWAVALEAARRVPSAVLVTRDVEDACQHFEALLRGD